jgi:N,N'-diacetyllegionaminate synthase
MVTQDASKADYQKDSSDVTETQYTMLKNLELSQADHLELIKYCKLKGIGFFSTGFDLESIDMLVSFGQEMFKIPSGEITNFPYLQHIGKIGKEIILSTGMSNMEEIEHAIEVLEGAGTNRKNITVLHCTSAYPAPMADVNLRAMEFIGQKLAVKVGYSDHTLGIEISLAAVALGASVIEKHFTFDRSSIGPDHKASLEPMELRSLIRGIRNIEEAMGDGLKRLMPSEIGNRDIARKSIVARHPILSGQVLSEENLTTKRPGTGNSPMEWVNLIGKKASRDYLTDEQIDES